MKTYTNEYGVKTSKKLDTIKDQAVKFVYGGKKGYSSSKFNTKTWFNLRARFEAEAEVIGGVNYTLGDSIA